MHSGSFQSSFPKQSHAFPRTCRRDDILVGAPLFMQWQSSKQLLEVGQVLVYLQKERSTFSSKPDQKLIGADAYGRFGSTVAPLGDIDQDGFNGQATSIVL